MSRILLVHQPIAGGVARHVSDLALGLVEEGHETVLCSPRLPDGLIGFAHESIDLQRAIAPRTDLSALARFSEIMRQVRPDVVHAHSSKAGVVTRVARMRHPGTPVVYTPHGYAFAGYFPSERERIAYREVERALVPLTTRVVCVCETEGRLAGTIGAGQKVRVIHNGVHTPPHPSADPRMAELAKRGPVVCALAQLRPGKGIETLVEASTIVCARDPDAQFAIWGQGPGTDAIAAQICEAGVGDRVHMLGTTTDPLSVLAGADIFVHPSWAESFPYVILEAMSVGRAIVTADVGGVSEAVTDGENGLLVPARDQRRLAEALLQLIADRPGRELMGEVGRDRVQRRFGRAGDDPGAQRGLRGSCRRAVGARPHLAQGRRRATVNLVSAPGPRDIIAAVTRVMIVHQPTSGGVGRHVSDLAAGLRERDTEAVLCGPRLPNPPDGVRHEPLDLQRPLNARHDLVAVQKLAAIVDRVRPDVIHAHSSKAGAVARLARVAHPRIPVVYSPHMYAFTAYFATPRKRTLYRELERTLSRLATRVVCVCADEGRLAARIGPKDRIRVVHNGIETPTQPAVDPRMAELAQRGPVVCALSELRPGKGIDTLIRASSIVRARHPSVQFAIWGAGRGLDQLVSMAREEGLADYVHFFGPTATPLSVLAGAAIFVQPSWAEAFPYVILEAMSIGLPIVATDVGGVGEAVTQGHTGLLVPARDEGRLAASLIELLEDPASRTSMGRAALEDVRGRFSRSSMVEALTDVYSEVTA